MITRSRGPVKTAVLCRLVVVVIGLDGCDDFTVAVVTAGTAHVVRALQLAAIIAFCKSLGLQRIVRAAHSAPGARDL